ncbi:hypothetical protein BDD12DRAFT_151885 [Trichophaea hybrida]|nr:hypothetical protein BDD12DRAFT_151885 [Trichophaea hybrida]
MAVVLLFVNLALFFNSYDNPVAFEAISWKYYFVYYIWLPLSSDLSASTLPKPDILHFLRRSRHTSTILFPRR